MAEGFDLYRIFFGEDETATLIFYVEIIFRTTVMYLYTIFLSRMVGQGGVGQIGPFEFVLVIAVGSASGDPMFYPDMSLFHGLLVITMVILLHRTTGFILNRSPKLERTLEGEPLLVVSDGCIVPDSLGSGTLTKRELMGLLRVAEVRNVGEVEKGYFESSGRLSVFRYPEDKQTDGESTFPEPDELRSPPALR